MKGKFFLAIVTLFALAWSIQTLAKGEKSQVQQDFEDDPSMLAIDSERWSVLIDRSNSGLDLLGQSNVDESFDDAYWLLRTDAALKADATQLLQLRNRLLNMRLVKASSVRTTKWPSWIFEPPTARVSPDTLAARLHWIATEADKLVEIGCNIGREKSNDTLFCSVE